MMLRLINSLFVGYDADRGRIFASENMIWRMISRPMRFDFPETPLLIAGFIFSIWTLLTRQIYPFVLVFLPMIYIGLCIRALTLVPSLRRNGLLDDLLVTPIEGTLFADAYTRVFRAATI